MNRYLVTITSDDPLSIGADRSIGNRVDTYRYIPGTVFRGAMAAAWIAEFDPPDASTRTDFIELFEGSTIFGPVTPVTATVVPLSVVRCKYRPEPECRDFAVDLAREQAGDLPECAVCEGPTALGKGTVIGVEIVERTRTALEGGMAKDGALFTRSAIARNTTFTGEILAENPAAIQWIESRSGTTLWIGGGRSTGGRATIDAIEKVPPANVDDLRAGEPAVLRLDGPAILVDAATRPLSGFTTSVLEKLLGVPVQIERQWVRLERTGGWNAVAGSPKPQEVAMSAGSTVRFVPQGVVDASLLASIVETGIGLRRNEGFGRISINPPPWSPPPASPDSDDPDGSRSGALFREALRLDLAGRQEVSAAIAEVSSMGSPTSIPERVGRGSSRRLNREQQDWLTDISVEDGAVLADLAILLDDFQVTRPTERGRGA